MAFTTAVVMAIAAAGATAYSAKKQNDAAKDAFKHAKGEAGLQRMYDEKAIKAAQTSPAAMFAPIMMGFATDVFGKAFAQHGFKLPADQIKSAMGLDRIIRNNAEGLPWNFNDEQYESEKTKQRGLERRAQLLQGAGEGDGIEGLPRAGMGGGGGGRYAEWFANGEDRPQAPQQQGPTASPMPAVAAPSYGGAMMGEYAAAPEQNQNLQPMGSGFANSARGIG